MFDRRLVENFDWGFLGIVLFLSVSGLIILYSAVTAGGSVAQQALFYKQIIWFCLGLFVMTIALIINYRELERWAPGIYIGCILLLIAVLFIGKIGGGSRRWLVVGPVTLQPSELAKIGLVIMIARHFSKNATKRGFSLRELFKPAVLIVIPFLLIVKQPDLGTAMLLVLIAASMTFFVGIDKTTLIFVSFAGAVTGILGWFFFLKPYQQERIMTFLNPDRDPLGAGYHIIQSKIAIGSGMITGKGFLKGTQNTLSFLPEQHTDFIISVLAEEWGFAGTSTLLLFYAGFLIWSLNIAHKSKDTFGTILSVGITSIIFWEMFINIGMVMGLMPVVGVPLPFISYGGSSVLTTFICVGILLSISMRRYVTE